MTYRYYGRNGTIHVPNPFGETSGPREDSSEILERYRRLFPGIMLPEHRDPNTPRTQPCWYSPAPIRPLADGSYLHWID